MTIAKMVTEKKNTPTGKSILLFSGGMDSLIMNFLLQPDVLLYFPHGQRYQGKEIYCLDTLMRNKIIDKDKVVRKPAFNFSSLERDDAIIPSRNLYFLLYAANYGENIYLGSVYGDRSLDKSLDFFNRAGEMLNYLYSPQHWCEGRIFNISAPFKHLTKTELVKKYLSNGGDPEHLLISYSCYGSDGGSGCCGWCKACFRKWVALVNNNIQISNYFHNDPKLAPWLPDLLPLIEEGKYRGREDLDILTAIAK